MFLHRYKGQKKIQFEPSIPMVCAHKMDQPFTTKNETAEPCLFNRISRDGMVRLSPTMLLGPSFGIDTFSLANPSPTWKHWCVESLGPRYSASIACLTGCVYNSNKRIKFDQSTSLRLRQCEQECNERLMSVSPVNPEWISSTGLTLYSQVT